MARIDKYDPDSGGFRAPLAAPHAATPGIVTAVDGPIGVGLDALGRVVPGAGVTGVKGLLLLTAAKVAGDIVDVMTDGEVVEAGGVAGTNYYALQSTGVLSAAIGGGATASANTGVVGLNNAVTWSANHPGDDGNDLSIEIVVAGLGTPLSVAVNGHDIVINSATDGGGLPTTTAAAAIAAIAADANANGLLSGANTGASTGLGVVADEGPTQLAGGADPGEDGAATRYVGHTVEASRLIVRAARI
jgi:hypothetical protein